MAEDSSEEELGDFKAMTKEFLLVYMVCHEKNKATHKWMIIKSNLVKYVAILDEQN